MPNKLNVAVIGCGYWGNHILRNFNNSNNWNLVAACDLDENQILKQSKLYPKVKFTKDSNEIFSNSEIDAISIATPVNTHYQLTKKSLEHGKHVWVEKPLCSSHLQAQELVKLAKANALTFNVDHTYIYTSAVQKLKEIVDSGEIGDIIYFDSVRINLGLFQHDINVIWDLAPHDISILNYLTNQRPKSLVASGAEVVKYSPKNLENIAYLNLNYEGNMNAHIHVNWLSPVKIRRIILGGTKKMVVFDDMLNSEKIKIYDSGVKISNREDIYQSLVQYRIGDMHSPQLSNNEALKEEVDHFFRQIVAGKDTITSGQMGADVVRVLEAADESIKQNSKTIVL